MTWSAVGSFLQAAVSPGPGTISLNNQAIGNPIFLITLTDSATNWVNSVTGGGATWTQRGARFTGTVNARTATIWEGVITATGAQTATMGITGGSPNIRAMGGEFHSSAGSWAFDVQGNLDGTGTNTYPSITPAGAGELSFGASIDSGSAVAGATSGYVYNVTAQGNGALWNVNCSSSAQAPVWGDSGHVFGTFFAVRETSSSVTASLSLAMAPLGESLTAAETIRAAALALAIAPLKEALTAAETGANITAAAALAMAPLKMHLAGPAAGQHPAGGKSMMRRMMDWADL